MTPRLSEADVRRFRRDGFLAFRRPVFGARSFAALERFLLRKMRGVPPEHFYDALDVPHLSSREPFRWLFSDDVLDIVEPLLGPDIALVDSRFFCKTLGHKGYVEWHVDPVSRRPASVPAGVRVWVALDPARRETGCVHVLPGSHRAGFAGGHDRVPARLAKLVEGTDGVPVELAPNEALLMDERLLHRSGPNLAAPRRAAFAMQFVSARLRWSGRDLRRRPIYLARGRDRAGNAYADPAVPARPTVFRSIASRLLVKDRAKTLPAPPLRRLFEQRKPDA